MSTTRTHAAARAQHQPRAATPELAALLGASATVLLGLLLVFLAKQSAPQTNQPLNLTAATREQVLPYLTMLASSADRELAARKIAEAAPPGGFPNVGALARLTVSEAEIAANPKLETYAARLAELKKRTTTAGEVKLSLFTARQFGQLKPLLSMRTPEQFRARLLGWVLVYFASLYAVFWLGRKLRGDGLLLPVVHLLTGIGLMLMVSIRDPLRDRLDFVAFVQGVVIGCAALLFFSFVSVERLQRLVYLPLLAALALSLALIVFGDGPTGSDAKVNLFNTQPVEAIKLLVVLFLAGFFADRWAGLRSLAGRPAHLTHLLSWFEVPRAKDFVPVVVSISLMLVFFFAQKDLGPALVLACTFLVLYVTARTRLTMTLVGFGMVVLGFWVSYRFGLSRTVGDRIRIWLAPWDSGLGGGIQLVHSFWALATGAASGTGLGLGEPQIVPAVHTDLILAAVGEELGFGGWLAVFALYALLVARGLRIALRAANDYAFFLALGLTSLLALQIILFAGGILGVIPLSGVVSPFLSFGKSAMIANCAIVGILLGLSARPVEAAERQERQFNFGWQVRGVGAVFAALALVVLGYAAKYQLWATDEYLVKGTLALQGDGKLRYQYNPRLEALARDIPKGSIYDRNGIPLATSDWAELERYRQQYELLGVRLDEACAKQDERHYPFGGLTFHLLGDRRTRFNWAARNTSFLERDVAARLLGFDDKAKAVIVTRSNGASNATLQRDYSELIPLLRYRHRPGHAEVQRLLNRERNVRTSLDIALQKQAADILQTRVQAAKKERGAAVVLAADTGDLLASVSYPWPENLRRLSAVAESEDDDEAEQGAAFDRARWGIYPPGSTFKVVTALAALRKHPQVSDESFTCQALNSRQGAMVRGHSVYDDEADGASGHGAVTLEQGLVQSCNAYFAQLAVERIGADALWQTASQMELGFTRDAGQDKLREVFRQDLPQAAYGQGPVYVTPFQMARVAAAVANGGQMPYGRWVIDDSNARQQAPLALVTRAQAALIAHAMRGVVLRGTGKRLAGLPLAIAGKTGTAENRPKNNEDKASHSWFIGFAPFEAEARQRFAFSVIVEHGGYGGALAAPIAGELALAAAKHKPANSKPGERHGIPHQSW